ncbi:hypothetical protein MJO10_33800, partial [Salmonella enterica subsp. enterica serovar Anatum]|nr:hypothetical protein [Salmonella enterica subsp. enterica serovar Anatum]
EVVHGKKSILDRMPGDAWQKFANLRAYYGWMWAFPGKKLLFITQKSMILARDLGYRLEGTDSDALEVKKYKGRFPYLCFLD